MTNGLVQVILSKTIERWVNFVFTK